MGLRRYMTDFVKWAYAWGGESLWLVTVVSDLLMILLAYLCTSLDIAWSRGFVTETSRIVHTGRIGHHVYYVLGVFISRALFHTALQAVFLRGKQSFQLHRPCGTYERYPLFPAAP